MFLGSWSPTNQMIGHKDGFFLLRLEMHLPWKINQIINKYLLKTTIVLVVINYNKHLFVWVTLPIQGVKKL